MKARVYRRNAVKNDHYFAPDVWMRICGCGLRAGAASHLTHQEAITAATAHVRAHSTSEPSKPPRPSPGTQDGCSSLLGRSANARNGMSAVTTPERITS